MGKARDYSSATARTVCIHLPLPLLYFFSSLFLFLFSPSHSIFLVNIKLRYGQTVQRATTVGDIWSRKYYPPLPHLLHNSISNFNYIFFFFAINININININFTFIFIFILIFLFIFLFCVDVDLFQWDTQIAGTWYLDYQDNPTKTELKLRVRRGRGERRGEERGEQGEEILNEYTEQRDISTSGRKLRRSLEDRRVC